MRDDDDNDGNGDDGDDNYDDDNDGDGGYGVSNCDVDVDGDDGGGADEDDYGKDDEDDVGGCNDDADNVGDSGGDANCGGAAGGGGSTIRNIEQACHDFCCHSLTVPQCNLDRSNMVFLFTIALVIFLTLRENISFCVLLLSPSTLQHVWHRNNKA